MPTHRLDAPPIELKSLRQKQSVPRRTLYATVIFYDHCYPDREVKAHRAADKNNAKQHLKEPIEYQRQRDRAQEYKSFGPSAIQIPELAEEI